MVNKVKQHSSHDVQKVEYKKSLHEAFEAIENGVLKFTELAEKCNNETEGAGDIFYAIAGIFVDALREAHRYDRVISTSVSNQQIPANYRLKKYAHIYAKNKMRSRKKRDFVKRLRRAHSR